MATTGQTQEGELNRCHLRSIGRKASVSGVAEIIHFFKAVTLIGRNKDVVDYFISCPVSERKDYMSRTHARVIRTTNTYRLVDSSLTGVYVNDVRICGSVILQEGDTVTFGHPAGNDIKPGTQVRQPNSEFYFLFEHCYCGIDQPQSACREMKNLPPQIQLPLLAAPETPQMYNSVLEFEKNVGLPIISQLIQTSHIVPSSGAESKSSTCYGAVQPSMVTVSLPLTPAGSVLSSAKSSLCRNPFNVTSNKSEMPPASTSTVAIPDTSPDSQIVRSASPEYVHGNSSTVTAEPSQQSVFEIAQSCSFQENGARRAELDNSDFFCVKPSEDHAHSSGSMPQFYRPFLDERHASGEIERQPPDAVCYNLEPSPPFPRSSDTTDTCDSSQHGRTVVRAGLPDNSLELSDPFQIETGSHLDPKTLAAVASKSVLGSCANADDDEEPIEIDIISSSKETAEHETSESSETGIQVQVREVINEAVKSAQVPSVSDYAENSMEKESLTEEQNEYVLEQHPVDVCMYGTPHAAAAVIGAETCEYHSKRKGHCHVNRLSESVTVENCLENSDCVTINRVPEDIALGRDPDSGFPAKEVVSPKKLVNAADVEELDLLPETVMAIDGAQEASMPFVPDSECPHSVWHSEIKNEICKDELTSVIKENSLMPNEKAVQESIDIVERDSCPLADRELETQKPDTTVDIQEGADPNNDRIMTISNRELGLHRDRVFEDKMQNALDQDYAPSDTGILTLDYEDSHNILTTCAAKEMSACESAVGSAKSQENENDRVSGVALFQSCVTEQVVSRASGTKIVQYLDVLHPEEEESSMDSHVVVDGLVTKILKNNAEPTAPKNLPSCAQYISDYHVHSPSKDHILSEDTHLEDVTYDSSCNCVPSSSESLHSEISSLQPSPKEEETCNSEAIVKPWSRTVVEMISPECPCRYEDSGAFASAKRSISEKVNQETNIQPLSQNETETSVKQKPCNKASTSHATLCIESEGFHSDHECPTTSVATKGVPQEVSDFGINDIHVEISASEEDEKQANRNVTMGSHVGHGDKDKSESKMDSVDTEARISSVTDYIEGPCAKVGTQSRLINEREINLLPTETAVSGNKNSVSKNSICEEEVNVSMDINLNSQQFSEPYQSTIQHNNASENSWKELSEPMELDSIAKKKLSSETFEEKPVFVTSGSSPDKVTLFEKTEKLVEAINTKPPIDVDEELIDEGLLQESDCTPEGKKSPWKEEDQSYVSMVERELEENTNTNCIKTVEVFAGRTLDSTSNERSDTDCQELKTTCSVVDDTTLGGEQYDQSTSSDNTFYEKTDEDNVESKEKMKIPGERHDLGTAINDGIFEQETNLEKEDLDKEMEIVANVCGEQTNLNHSSITEEPTNRLKRNTAYYSSDLEEGKANDLSPLCLSKLTSLVAERSLNFNDYSCSQIQSPYYETKRDMENIPEPLNDYSLPQKDTRNEEDMKLNDEKRVEAVNHKWSVKSVTVDNEFKHSDACCSEFDLGTLNNCQEENENLSVSSAHLAFQQQSGADDEQQETDSHAVEFQHLDSKVDWNSKEDIMTQSLYPKDFIIDSGRKKLREQNMTTEILTLTGLESSDQRSIYQEESGIQLQTSELDTRPCSVDRNDFAVGRQTLTFEKPESAKENMNENLIKETETDSIEGSESFSSEELNFSASEVEKEKEEDNMRTRIGTEMQSDGSKILKERDTVVSDPNSVSSSVILPADLDCKPNKDQLGRVIETAHVKSMIGSEKSTDLSLEEKSYSLCNAEYDLSEVRIAGPENCSTGMVVGESGHLVKNPTLREEKTENQTTADCNLEPVCLYSSIEFPCVPESQREMEAVKGYAQVDLNKGDAHCSGELVGNVDSNSVQGRKNLEENLEPKNSLLDDCSKELDVETPSISFGALKSVKGSPVNEMLTSLCAEKDDINQKTETDKLVYMQQESQDCESLKSQANLCQPTECANVSEGSNEGLNVSESTFMNRMGTSKEQNKAQNKKTDKTNYFRAPKRHIDRDKYSETSLSEDEQCSQKRICPLRSLAMQESVSDLPSPNVALFSTPTDVNEKTLQRLNEVEKENSKNIARLVREFFKKRNDSENLVNENPKPEMSVPPIESKVEDDSNCTCVGEIDSDGWTRRDGSNLRLLSSIDPPVNGNQSVKLISESQSLPLESQFRVSELAASSADSQTGVLEKDASQVPESPSADSLSEEEQFQSRVCLALDSKYFSAKSPLTSPDVASEQSTKASGLDFIFSDLSNSSVEGDHHLLTQKVNSRISSGAGDGLPTGVCSDSCDVAGIDTVSGFSCNSLDASAAHWSRDTTISSDLVAAARESSQCVASEWPQKLESEDHVESITDRNELAVLHEAEGALDGDRTPSLEDLSIPASHVTSLTGASPSSPKSIFKVESDADQHEAPEFCTHSNTQHGEIFGLQTKSACSPCQDVSPAATVDWNPHSPTREPIVARVKRGAAPQTRLKRELSPREHDGSISPPSKKCPLVAAVSPGSANEEPAPNQKEIGAPDTTGSSSASQTSLTDLAQTPSMPVTSDHLRECPAARSPVTSALHKRRASETADCSLPGCSSQPRSVANLPIQDRIPSSCTFEARRFSRPASERACSSDEEAACHSKGFAADMEEFPSTATESLRAVALLSRTKTLGSFSAAENAAPKASSSSSDGMESEARSAWASSEGDIEFQLSQCQTVLGEISQALRAVEGIDEAHMNEWRDQIETLQKDTKMPKTYIAVVGNTGAGKSSLLNALLDEEAVLPTSAMRACTAVVVEISRNAGKSLYEADVEFLSKEEWDNELKALLEDMKDKSGNLKKRCPDRKTEAGAAYSRVKAVYGMIAELPKLKEMKEVTQHLGTVKHISAEKASDFRTKIEKFIDSRTDNLRDMKGGEFWPIVKCVKICVPGADVLKTGAVLVDLPGIRDSNAARDNAAKEYLKNCNAVWVVASITRAVDDKTAKEMLSANLRRQLLMDGQFGSLAFVCTKTDDFNVTEIMSDLDLRGEIQPIERSLGELENQRVQMELEKDSLYFQLQQEQQQQEHGPENPASFQTENDIRKKILEKEFKISSLQREREKKLRDISLICVQSRNQFSKQRIWMDFKNSLQAMRRKAACAEGSEDEEEEEPEDEDLTTSDTSDPREDESQHGKLQVFTVSSTEYLKLHGKLLRDGQPQVFHSDEDTEIPALKKFAIHTALQHSMVATEKVIRNVARVISQVVNYLTNQRAEDNSHRAQVQELVQDCLLALRSQLQEVVEDSLQDIQFYFSVLILSNLKKGAIRAEEMCEDKVRSWGLPGIGYPYATYRAVCARHGLYSSVACGFVDFNEQLTEPISSAISMTWNEVFSCRLGESINQFSKAILDALKYFFKDLKSKLQKRGRNTEPVSAIQRHQMEAVQALFAWCDVVGVLAGLW
ncbi:uncharacterized protein LOC102447370 isoform X4 [Pelodiscus sinensis]|uniref:uncharacterized protein LOC102447370 isoform X4 n=1 Tax=Pelodiscus sinensis TaxID=13735 RepID=UPI003F6B3CE5